MAKQLGVHKLHGKVDEQSYYYSKNGGYQSRKINPGMGARVKNDAAYANTRLNNAEFGACGACAGAMIRPVTQRWRFILDSIATGKMVKAMKAAMEQDTNHAWGKRLIPVSEMAGIQEVFNSFSKNEVPQPIKNALQEDFIYDSGNLAIELLNDVELGNDDQQYFIDKGATGVTVKVFQYTVSAPQISSSGDGYTRPMSLLSELPSYESEADFILGASIVIINSGIVEDSLNVINDSSHFGGILVLVLPYKTVGGNTHVLQELCSAAWVSAKAGTVNP